MSVAGVVTVTRSVSSNIIDSSSTGPRTAPGAQPGQPAQIIHTTFARGQK